MGAAPQNLANAAALRKRRTSPAWAMIVAARLLPTPMEVFERVVVLVEQLGDLGVEGGDALVEVVDVAGELADAACGGALNEAVAEIDALELS